MPQLDLATYFSEYVSFLILFFFCYLVGLLGIFPRLIRLITIRKFVLNTLSLEISYSYYFFNQLYLWSFFLSGYWFILFIEDKFSFNSLLFEIQNFFNIFFHLYHFLFYSAWSIN